MEKVLFKLQEMIEVHIGVYKWVYMSLKNTSQISPLLG